MTTQHPTHSTFDLPLAVAEDRMADLRASARPGTTSTSVTGRLAQARTALGHRLIAIGSALAVDEAGERRQSVA